MKFKLIAVIASYRRGIILQDTIDCLKPQVDDIVIVGSSEWVDGVNGCSEEKKIAVKNSLIYVDHKNDPLGQKWQAGLNEAHNYLPDAIMIVGSDDFILPTWGPDAKEIFSDYRKDWRYDVLGMGVWNVYNAPTREMISCNYRTRNDPIGAGRVIRSSVLDGCGWQIFPTVGGIGCDAYSFDILKKHLKGRVGKSFNRVLSVKGTWRCMDTWSQICRAESLEIDCIDAMETAQYLKMNFPKIDFEKYAV